MLSLKTFWYFHNSPGSYHAYYVTLNSLCAKSYCSRLTILHISLFVVSVLQPSRPKSVFKKVKACIGAVYLPGVVPATDDMCASGIELEPPLRKPTFQTFEESPHFYKLSEVRCIAWPEAAAGPENTLGRFSAFSPFTGHHLRKGSISQSSYSGRSPETSSLQGFLKRLCQKAELLRMKQECKGN